MEKYVYLDHAAVGPLPQRVLDAMVKTAEEKRFGELHWPDWEALVEKTRKTIAQFIKANIEEIALVPNTSEGIGIVANGITWRENDNIVTTDLEFASNLFPWQDQARRHNVELRIVANKDGRLLIEDFEKNINRNTRIVAVSHVQFSNGFKVDLEALSKLVHENDAYLLVDAVQSVGQMPVDVKKLDIDFLATSGYKWLLSPIATGFLYVRRDLIEEIELSIVGYRSDKNLDDYSFREFDPCESARRFEHGQLNFPGLAGMCEAILMLEGVNMRNVEERILTLTDRIIEGVQEISTIRIKPTPTRENRSGIMSLVCNNAEDVGEKMIREGIVVSVRRGGIRVSPHFYNIEEEIDKFLASLSRLVKEE